MSQHKGRILVVDDAGEVVVFCVNMLQSLGYPVKGTSRADLALAALASEPFDVALLDFCMPDLDGFALREHAALDRPDIAFVLMTGYGSPEVVERALRDGFAATLLKPFTRAELGGVVEQALASRSGRVPA